MNSSTELTPATSRPGRPRILNDVKRSQIIALVSAGFTIDRAARYVRCAPSTIRREFRRNPEFADQLERAMLAAELAPLQTVRQAASKHWRAGAWLLERLDPERFAKRDPRYVSVDDLQSMSDSFARIFTEEVASPDERQRIQERLEATVKSMERSMLTNANPTPRKRARRRASNRGPADFDMRLAQLARQIDERAAARLSDVEQEVELRASCSASEASIPDDVRYYAKQQRKPTDQK